MSRNKTSPHEADGIETLRERLQRLAEYAPTTVLHPDEIRLAPRRAAAPPRRRWLTIGVPIAALVAGGGITAVATTGQGDAGAASPIEAVERLVTAAESEDVLGMLDTLVPEEVAAMRHSLDDLTSEAARVGLLDRRFSLSGIDGLDVSTEGLQLVIEELGDHLAVVRAIGGSLATSFDPAAFALGRPLLDALDTPPRAATTVTDLAGSAPFVATVERDGRWYVSLTYTAAEAARRTGTDNVPPTAAVEPEGFDTPELAAEAFYRRLVALDLTGLVALAAPGEGEALARYAPLWIPGATSAIDGARSEGLTLALDGLQTRVTGDGSFRRVEPTAFHISGAVPPGWYAVDDGDATVAPSTFDWQRSGDCRTLTGALADRLVRIGYPATGDGFSSCGATTPMGAGLFTVLRGSTQWPPDLPEVEVTERGGRWYVSPIGTVLGEVVQLLRGSGDGDVGIDSPLALYIHGTNRQDIDSVLQGRGGDIPESCAAIVVVDQSDQQPKLVADPDLRAVRACSDDLMSSSMSSSSVGFEVAGPVGSIAERDSTVYAVASSVAEPVAEPATTLAGG